MREPQQAVRPGSGLTEREYVEFWPAGTVAKGRFSCTGCGNTITVQMVVPRCTACGERLWERAESSPYVGVS